MKIWTVTATTYIEGLIDDISPFVQSFRTKNAAVQAVEAAAVEDFEYMVDPNDGDAHPFPGCDWNEDMTVADGNKDDEDDDNKVVYNITETTLEG